MSPTAPPALARWIVERWLSGEAREAIVGDLDERFQFDLAAGLTAAEARARYWRHALASVAAARPVRQHAQSEDRAMRRSTWLLGIASDVRYVVRGLVRQPTYAAVAVLSLAIGIGANVATLSILRAIVFQQLPVSRPDELQWVNWGHPSASARRSMNFNSSNGSNFSYPAYQALRVAAGPGIQMLGFNFARGLSLTAAGRPPIDANGMIVSGDFFATLGLPVILGRPLGPIDDAPGAPPVAVISASLWERAFNRDPTVITRSLAINGVTFDVVGVTPRAYAGLSIGGFFPPTDVTLPLSAQPVVAPNFVGDQPLALDPTRNWIHVIVRLPPSADRERFRGAALAALAPLDGAAEAGGPSEGSTTVTLTPASRGVNTVGQSAAQPLGVLSGVSGLVLLIACANLAGLMLARGVARGRETAVRRALGASRTVLVRQWILEGALLAIVGGASGVAVAIWSGPAIVHLLTTGLGPVAIDLAVDWRLIGLAFGLTMVTAILSSAVPAWRLTATSATADLRTQVIGANSSKLTIGRLLIAVQMAISVPLLVGALLFVRTLHNLAAVDLGFDTRGLVMFQLNLPQPKMMAAGASAPASPERARFISNMLAALEAIPGVSSATIIENPLVSGFSSNRNVTIDGTTQQMFMQAVGPRYFETMRIPIVAGRAIGPQDTASAPAVALVNRAAVDQLFHGQSPIGKTILAGTHPMDVIGVVEDSVYASLRRKPAPTFYDAYLQRPGQTYTTYVGLRTTIAPSSLLAPIAAAVARVDPNVPIAKFKTQDDQIADSTGRERVFERLLTLFAVFAILLACIGLYGLTSYAVARRTNEIGIRLALGARRSHVQGLMLRQVIVLAVVGLAAGIPLALYAARFVASYVYGVEPRDPVTLVTVALTMLIAAVAAGWVPARRASRLEPLSALRRE